MKSLSPSQALHAMSQGARLIDVRDLNERAAGFAAGSESFPLAELIDDPVALIHAGELVFICQKGPRSIKAAELMAEHGHRNSAYVEGGSDAWKSQGLAWTADDFAQRYARHLTLAEVGIEGQKKIESARIAIVGAGGLGSPVAFYLAAAGVGHIVLIDDDTVDRSNLQRQILHSEATVGIKKVASAKATLEALNPSIRIVAVDARLTALNAEELLRDADLIVDGADNFAARHLINDACLKLGKPWVYAALQQFDGHVSLFDASDAEAPCYRCLFPEAPDASFAPNCSEAGVLGVLPGLVGMIQATEALKWILGIGDPLIGKLLQVDALGMQFRTLKLRKDPSCPACGTPSQPSIVQS